jgi:hypothetical protein
MAYATTLRKHRQLIKCAAVTVLILLLTSLAAAQAAAQPEMPWAQELKKYPGLQAELVQLMTKLQHNIQFPAPRGQSRLLPLMPESTVFYAAFPNYGDASHQALTIFRQEVQQSKPLRDWWQHGELATAGPKVEDALDKFYQLSQYLGDEIVVSGATKGGQGPSLFIVAEVRKPGLKAFLQQMMVEFGDKSKPAMPILDVQELAAAKDKDNDKDGRPSQEPVVLVRPDFVIVSLDMAELRSFNARLEKSSPAFASTPFGQRVAQAYNGGTTVVAAADLRKILQQIPASNDPRQMAFQRSGFADMKYLVLGTQDDGGRSGESGRVELYRSAAWSSVLAGRACAPGQPGFCFAQSDRGQRRAAQEPGRNL